MPTLPPTGPFDPNTRELIEEVEHAYELKHNDKEILKHPVQTIELKDKSRRASFINRRKN